MNLFENLQLMKEFNNWEYCKAPKGYDGTFARPNRCEDQDYCGDIADEIDAVDIDDVIEEGIEDNLDTYIWYGKYDAVPLPPRYNRGDKSTFNKKVMFRFSSGDYEEANEEFKSIIPEPYSRCKLLGKVLDRKSTYDDLSKSGFMMIGSDIQEDINTGDIVEEDWQDSWVEPYVEKEPIEEINGLYIHKGINKYGDEVYYLFLEDEDPDPGYEEWQTETLELAREWAKSYEDPDDFDDGYFDNELTL